MVLGPGAGVGDRVRAPTGRDGRRTTINSVDEERDDIYVTPVGEPNPDDVAAFWARYLRAAGSAAITVGAACMVPR